MGDTGVSSVDYISAAFQAAARLAAITDLRDIRLMKSHVEMVRSPATDPFLAYHLDADSAVEYEPGTESFVVRGTYRVSITSASTADAGNNSSSKEPDSTVARIEFEQAALFVMEIGDDKLPNSEELNAYAISTGQYALYPYAREYISDLTMRLGLPPLTIGVLKIPFHMEKER